MKLQLLIGSGRKIGIFFFPFLLIGLSLNYFYPDFFAIGGPPLGLFWLSIFFLFVGIVNWVWTVVLLLTKVPQKKLITTGPYVIVKHPLYVGMALLVLPWLSILMNSWLGIILGLVMYVGSRLYSPEEEEILFAAFGNEWLDYREKVLLPWI